MCTKYISVLLVTKFYKKYIYVYDTSLVDQTVKNLPVMRETQLWSLGQEDPLEKGRATHSSILDWRIPWTEDPGGLKRVRHDWATFTL